MDLIFLQCQITPEMLVMLLKLLIQSVFEEDISICLSDDWEHVLIQIFAFEISFLLCHNAGIFSHEEYSKLV